MYVCTNLTVFLNFPLAHDSTKIKKKRKYKRVLLHSVHMIGYHLGVHPQPQKLDHLVQHNKQHHRKVLLSSFHLNGHT